MRRPYLPLLLATLAGAGLRLWQINQVPPGLHYDLAATALLGNAVAFEGYRPVFITAYTGHEVLFYYWLALWFRLIGSSIFSLRLAAALLGVLTIPAAYFAVRQALGRERRARQQAALAACLLAFAFFHVVFSRFGFRVISEPLVQSLALGCLFRGLRAPGRPDLRWLALAGVFTGLAAYTYLAARLFPVPLAVFWLALGVEWIRSGKARAWGPAFAVFGLSALAAFSPLGLYFLQHPADFLNRAGQVAPRAGEAGLLLQGMRRAAEMVFIDGEPYDRFNIPGRPLFGPLLGLLFVIGLLDSLRRVARPGPAGRAVEWMLLAWLPAMLLPTAVSVHDVFPSNVRAFGLIPLLFVFPARGLVALLEFARGRARWPDLKDLSGFGNLTGLDSGGAALLLCLAAGTLATGYAYFVTWASLPSQRMNNDADLTAVADYLNAQDLSGTAVFVSAIHYRHPTLAYLARDYAAIRWLYGGASLALPAGQEALVIFARSAPPPEDWTAGWKAYQVAAPGDSSAPDFRAYRFAPGQAPPLPDFVPAAEDFAHAIFLTGYRVLPETEALQVDLRWHIENLVEAPDMIPYLRLHDAWGDVWSQSEGFHYPSEQWQPGDMLLTRVALPLPLGLPPGRYTLRVGFYSESTQASLAHLDAQGRYAGERSLLAEVDLPGRLTGGMEEFLARNPVAPPQSQAGLDSGLALLGYSLPRLSARQGEYVDLRLFWSAPRPDASAQVSITLGGRLLYHGQPVRGSFPFADWIPGQVLIDRYRLRIPPDFPTGSAGLAVDVSGQGSAVLTALSIDAVERVFSAPQAQHALGYGFGGQIGLLGYDLAPGPQTALTLFWAGGDTAGADYTVFVHVLGAGGQVAAQADAPPRSGGYPTSLWVPGEFVPDPYVFSLPPGEYTVEAGLYLAETGERLPITDAAGRPLGDAARLATFEVP